MASFEAAPETVAGYEVLAETTASTSEGDLGRRLAVPLHVQPAPAIRLEPRRSGGRRLAAALGGSKWSRAAIDASMLFLGAVAAIAGAKGANAATGPGWLPFVFPLLVLSLLGLRGGYSPRLLVRVLDGARQVLAAASMAAIFLVGFESVVHVSDSGTPIVRLWLFSSGFLIGGRVLLGRIEHWSRVAGLVSTPALIFGAGEVGAQIARRLLTQPEYGLTPVGFVDSDPPPPNGRKRPIPVLGGFDSVGELLDKTKAGHVILAFSSLPDSMLLPLIRSCDDRGIRVSLVPRLFESVNDRLTLQHLGGLPVLSLQLVNPKGWQFMAKHAFDRVTAAFLLLSLLPLGVAVALLIKLTSRGPVLFRQRRVGRDGKVFDLLKYRSMTLPPGPEQFIPGADLAPGGVEGGDRRTFVGRLIRRYSIDELPQLINVMRGEMSLIGPRPERPEYVDLFRRHHTRYTARHRVKSGITGWAQVHGLRGQTSLSDRIEWDNYYIENWSLWLDVKILIMTVAAVFRGE